jgi:hypothetical protein
MLSILTIRLAIEIINNPVIFQIMYKCMKDRLENIDYSIIWKKATVA